MASENQIKHRIVISGEQEYKRSMREMSAQLKEAKSEVKATAAEMDNQGKSIDTLTAQMKALESQRQKESDMLREMQRHLEAVVEATGAESEEAVKLRTRINAMRAEVAQTSSQLSRMTGELDEAREAAEGLGDSAAATGIRGLGAAAQGAEGDLDGILGKLGTLGQGFTIGIGASIGANVLADVKESVAKAVEQGWNEAIESRIEYNKLGVQTGTAGTKENGYMAGILDRLKLGNPNKDASELIAAIAAAYTQFDETTFGNGSRLNDILSGLNAAATGVGTSLPEAVNWVGQMEDVFGESPEDLSSVYYWLGTSQAGNDGISVMQQYATSWKDIGMNAVGAAGALVLARIAGVDNLSAVGKAANEAQQFILENKEGLDELGVLADDLPGKFQKGGEEAKAAMKLLIESFLNASPETQAELGPQIFGQQEWERYGTRIAEAILGGYETELTPGMKTSLDNAQKALSDDLKSQNAITEELKGQILGELFTPWETILLEAQTTANQRAIKAKDEGKAAGVGLVGEWIAGFLEGAAAGVEKEGERQQEERFAQMASIYGEDWQKVLQENFEEGQERAAQEMENRFGVDVRNWITLNTGEEEAENEGEKAAETVMDAYARGFARNPRMREFDLFGEPAEEAGKEAASTILDAYAQGLSSGSQDFESVKAQVENLNAQIAAALGAGDSDLVADLTAKRDALIPVMMQLAANVKTTGEDSASDFDTAFKGVEVTVEDTMTGAVEKLQSGAEQFAPTGKQGIDSLLAELEAGQDPAWNAGWNMADQFDKGFRERMDMHSPSRVMAEAGRFTIEGLMQGLDNGAGDLERRAASVSEILSSGARSAGSGVILGNAGYAGLTIEDLDNSLDRFAGKVALTIDGEIAGGLLERGVSSATARRAAGTIRGRSAAQRSW